MMYPFDASILCIEQFGVTSQLAQRSVDRPELAVVSHVGGEKFA